MRTLIRLLLTMLIALAALSSAGWAQTDDESDAEPPTSPPARPNRRAPIDEFEDQVGSHTIAIGIGGTHEEAEDGTTLGVNYEYRLVARTGVGLIVEGAASPIEAAVLALPVFLHPWRGAKIITAPGFHFTEVENNFLFRVSGMYELGIGRVWIAPGLAIDFVDRAEITSYTLQLGVRLGG